MTHSDPKALDTATPIRRQLGIAAIMACCLAPPASAGVIRHDVAGSYYTDLAQQPPYSGVGAMVLYDAEWKYGCSGTVISPVWVLTAAHCLSLVGDSPEDPLFRIAGVDYEIAGTVIHEKWGSPASDMNFDIALIKVATKITGVPFAPLYSGTDEVGKVGTNVGFGMTGDGYYGAVATDNVKRAGHNMISATGGYPRVEDRSDTLLFEDFDSPDSSTASWWDPKVPLDLEIMPAEGDSGGGLFIDVNGTSFLAGIHSYVIYQNPDMKSQYGDVVASTRVSSYVDWIEAQMAPAPATAWLLAGGLPLLHWGRSAIRGRRRSAATR